MAFDLQAALTQHFGYGAFRKGQEAIMRSVLSSRPTIAILPTGGGKSLCYQLPALLLEGLFGQQGHHKCLVHDVLEVRKYEPVSSIAKRLAEPN